MPQVFIGIGSNIEPQQHIPEAIEKLSTLAAQIRCSPIYQAPAIGFDGQDFHNLVVELICTLPLPVLITQLEAIEQAMLQSKTHQSYTSRVIDLDLLLYDQAIMQTRELELPRSDILKFPFVLKPMADLAPDLNHPLLQQTYAELWQHYKKDYLPLRELNLKKELFVDAS